jgi:hypothetical protein
MIPMKPNVVTTAAGARKSTALSRADTGPQSLDKWMLPQLKVQP